MERDVRAPNGRLLFKKDTVLTDKHILVLKTWGVLKVEVSNNEKIKINSQDSGQTREDILSLYFPQDEIKYSPMKDIYVLSKKI